MRRNRNRNYRRRQRRPRHRRTQHLIRISKLRNRPRSTRRTSWTKSLVMILHREWRAHLAMVHIQVPVPVDRLLSLGVCAQPEPQGLDQQDL